MRSPAACSGSDEDRTGRAAGINSIRMICAVSLSRQDSAVTSAYARSVLPDVVIRETIYRLQGPCAWQTFAAEFDHRIHQFPRSRAAGLARKLQIETLLLIRRGKRAL